MSVLFSELPEYHRDTRPIVRRARALVVGMDVPSAARCRITLIAGGGGRVQSLIEFVGTVHVIVAFVAAAVYFLAWRRSGFWLPAYVHVLAGIGLLIGVGIVATTGADAPVVHWGIAGQLFLLLVCPVLVYFCFVFYGGQVVALDARDSRAHASGPSQPIAATLREEAASALARHPDLRHEWSDDGTVVTLRFPPANADGFDVMIQAGEGDLCVFMGANHHHFDIDPRNPKESVTVALGLVRDLLTPNMRLRERRVAGRPYRWLLEAPTTDAPGRSRIPPACCSSTTSARVPSMSSRTTSSRRAWCRPMVE
jgi:hypothetical protein